MGVSCPGTRLSEAISLLEPLTLDVIDFVKGALIATVMVLVQKNELCESRVGNFRYVVPWNLQWLRSTSWKFKF